MKRLPPGTPIIDRIVSKVAPEPNTGCWLWTGHIDSEGYGRLKVAGRCALAHRESYVAHGGSVDGARLLRHKCDVRACVNPAHLEPGSDMDNTNDAVERGSRVRRLDDIDCVRVAMAVRHGAQFEEVGSLFGVNKAMAHRAWKKALRMIALQNERPEVWAALEVVG